MAGSAIPGIESRGWRPPGQGGQGNPFALPARRRRDRNGITAPRDQQKRSNNYQSRGLAWFPPGESYAMVVVV